MKRRKTKTMMGDQLAEMMRQRHQVEDPDQKPFLIGCFHCDPEHDYSALLDPTPSGKSWVCRRCGHRQLHTAVVKRARQEIRAFYRKHIRTKDCMRLPSGKSVGAPLDDVSTQKQLPIT